MATPYTFGSKEHRSAWDADTTNSYGGGVFKQLRAGSWNTTQADADYNAYGKINTYYAPAAPAAPAAQPTAVTPTQQQSPTQSAPTLTSMAQSMPTAPAQTTPTQTVQGTTYYNGPNGSATTTPPTGTTQPTTVSMASTSQPQQPAATPFNPLAWKSGANGGSASWLGDGSNIVRYSNAKGGYDYGLFGAGNAATAIGDWSDEAGFNAAKAKNAGLKDVTWASLTGQNPGAQMLTSYSEGGQNYNLSTLSDTELAKRRADAAAGRYAMADGGTYDMNAYKAQQTNGGAGLLAPKEVAPGYWTGATGYTLGTGQDAAKAAPTNPLYANNPTGSPTVAAQQAAASPNLAQQMANEQQTTQPVAAGTKAPTPAPAAGTQAAADYVAQQQQQAQQQTQQAAVNSGQQQAGGAIDKGTEDRLNQLMQAGDQTEYNRILDYLVQTKAMDPAVAAQRKAGSAAYFQQPQQPTLTSMAQTSPTGGGFRVQGGTDGGQQPTWGSVGKDLGGAMTDLSGGLTNIMNLLAKQTGQPAPAIPTAGTGVNGYAPRPGTNDPSVGTNGVWTTKDGQQFTLNDQSIAYMKQTGQIPQDWQPPSQPGTQYATATGGGQGITVPPAWKGMDAEYKAMYQQMIGEGWTPEQINSNQGQTIIGGRLNRGDNVAQRTVLNEQQMDAIRDPNSLDSILQNPNQRSYAPQEAAAVQTLTQMQATPPAANPGGSAQPGSTTPDASAKPGGATHPGGTAAGTGASSNAAGGGATFYPGQQNYAQNQQTLLGLLGAYGGQTANAFNNRANPYGYDNPALQGRNAASVADARTQTANAAEQARRNRVATGMDTSGLSAADRRNIEMGGAATLSEMLNKNRVDDYDKGAAWDTQNRQLGLQADNTHISQIMSMNGNDRANFQAGQQKDQFDQQLADDKDLKAAMFDQSFWNGILGGAGKLAGGFTEWATSPKGMAALADIAQKTGTTVDAVIKAASAALGLTGLAASTQAPSQDFPSLPPSAGAGGLSPEASAPLNTGNNPIAPLYPSAGSSQSSGFGGSLPTNPTPAEGTQTATLPGQSKGIWENIGDGLNWFFGGVWNTLTTGSPDGKKSSPATGGVSYDPSIPGPPGRSGFGTQSLTAMSQSGPMPQPITPTQDMSFDQWVNANAERFNTTPEKFIWAVHSMAQKAGA